MGVAGLAASAGLAVRDMVLKRKRNGSRRPRRGVAPGAAVAGGVKRTRRVRVRRPRLVRRGVKRLAPASFGARKRARTVTTKRSASSGTLSYRKIRIGRSRPMSVQRLAKLSTYQQISRFQNIGPFDKSGERGAFALGNLVSTNATLTQSVGGTGYHKYAVNSSTFASPGDSGAQFRPSLHMYLLNGTELTETSAIADRTVAFQPFVDLTNGAISFSALHGMQKDTTLTSPYWQAEYSNLPTTNASQRYVQQRWYDINLALRNCTTQVTYYDIWIVRFKEAHLDPLENPGSVEELRDRRAFWQGLSGAAYRHPVVRDASFARVLPRVNIVKKIRVVMPKEVTTDDNSTVGCRVVRWFIRDGRVYDYSYASQPPVGTEAGLGAAGIFADNSWPLMGPGTSQVSTRPYPKARARMWLMIRAYDPTLTGSAAAVTANLAQDSLQTVNVDTPTYDILIRKSEVGCTA